MSLLQRYRIHGSLLIAVGLIIATPLSQSLAALLPWSIVGMCLLFALFAAVSRDWFDVGLAAVMGLAFAVAPILFPNPDGSTITLRTAALVSYALLNAVLLIGPWSRFVPKIRGWYKHRRHMGVTVFLLGLLHASIVLNVYFNRSVLLAWQAVFIFFGSVALFVMALLAITSWDWVQKHVPWRAWMVIHAASLGIFLAMTWNVMGIWRSAGDIPAWTYPVLGSFVLFWVIVAPWGLAPRLFKVVNGWKQFHVLVYIAYASVVIHVYFGAAEGQGLWAQAVVLALLALVMGSHLVGWIMNWREKKQRRIPEQPTAPWYDVGPVADLQEGVGKPVMIHGLPVAVFLHQRKVLAYFGFCSHQKGPLWQGKIVDGYLECPWHNWQFSVTDGKGPPGFHDSVPFYETRIENGRAWVKVEQGKECEGYGCASCSCKGCGCKKP